jgi:hypothetical protein
MSKTELLGTLDLLILRTLEVQAGHGIESPGDSNRSRRTLGQGRVAFSGSIDSRKRASPRRVATSPGRRIKNAADRQCRHSRELDRWARIVLAVTRVCKRAVARRGSVRAVTSARIRELAGVVAGFTVLTLVATCR